MLLQLQDDQPEAAAFLLRCLPSRTSASGVEPATIQMVTPSTIQMHTPSIIIYMMQQD
jgi:hypothetical protein